MKRSTKIAVGVVGGLGLAALTAVILQRRRASLMPATQGCPLPQNVTATPTVNYTAQYPANGTSVTMNVGDKLTTQLLVLSPGTDWQLQSQNDSIMARNASVPHSLQQSASDTTAVDQFVAKAAGTTKITGSQVGSTTTWTLTVKVVCPG